jgi:O-antigen ligase
VFATLDNPNVLAEFLVFTIPLSLAMLWSSANNGARIFITGIIGLSVLCLVLTLSRGGWLGFALAMLVFFLLKDRRALFLLLVMGLVGIFFLPDSILLRVASIGNLQESSTAYRLSIWTATLRIISDYWVSGIGLGLPTFAMVYPYYSLAAGMAYHSHNLFLQLIVEMGIVGLGAFLWLMWVFVKVGLNGIRRAKDPFLKNLMIGLLAGMSGYLLQGLTDYVWYSPRLILTFWLMLGLMAATIKQAGGQSLPEFCRKEGETYRE